MVAITVRVDGIEDVQAALRRANPGENPRIAPGILLAFAKPIQRNAADIQITKGGRGKGKQLAALAHKLTSRSGGAGLVGSIAINRGPLPRAIEIGTHLAYGAVHEFGGRISFPSSRVKSHTRSVAFGRKVKPFTVPSFTRSAYSASYPKRSFLGPALKAVSPRFGAIAVREWRKQAKL